MTVLLFVIDRRAPLHDLLQRGGVERLVFARRAPDFFRERQRGATVAVRHADQGRARVVIERQLAPFDRLGAIQQFFDRLRIERLEDQHTRAGEERRDQFE